MGVILNPNDSYGRGVLDCHNLVSNRCGPCIHRGVYGNGIKHGNEIFVDVTGISGEEITIYNCKLQYGDEVIQELSLGGNGCPDFESTDNSKGTLMPDGRVLSRLER